MFIDSEKLVCLSFPGFGQVVILLKDVTAKDSNSIVPMSLCPGATTASPNLELQEQQLCRHSPRDCGETASTKTETQCCLSTALTLTFVPHRQLCCLCPLQGHGAPSAPDTTAPREAQGGEHSNSQGSWMQQMLQLRASSSRSSWLPHVTWPGFGQVPRQRCHEKALSLLVTQCHTILGNCPMNFTNSVLAVCVDRGSSGFQQQQNHPFLPSTAGREDFYLKKPSVLHFSEH